MKSDRILNGYVLVYKPDHPKAMKCDNWDGYIYEHILIGEKVIDRQLREGEEVHHLDLNRSNNSPDNILVLPGPMHMKLHGWLDKNTIIPNSEYSKRIDRGCVRCKICNTPINHDLQYCSVEHYAIDKAQTYEQSRTVAKPSKETLQKEVKQMPMSTLGKKYQVSDKTIKNWCVDNNINTTNTRGFWNKVKAGKLCPI